MVLPLLHVHMVSKYTPFFALFVSLKPNTMKVLLCCYFCRHSSTFGPELMNNYHVSCPSRLLFVFSLVSDRERRRGEKVGDRY